MNQPEPSPSCTWCTDDLPSGHDRSATSVTGAGSTAGAHATTAGCMGLLLGRCRRAARTGRDTRPQDGTRRPEGAAATTAIIRLPRTTSADVQRHLVHKIAGVAVAGLDPPTTGPRSETAAPLRG